MDNNYFASGQFLIETEYEHYDTMHKVMLNSFTETTEYPDRTQNSIDLNSISLDYVMWVLKKIQALNIPIEHIEPDQSWYITYNPYGYQGIHNHTNKTNLISTVMYFDNKEEEDMFTQDGCLVTMLAHPNTQIEFHEFPPSPGKTIIMNGNVNHATYPYKHKRRCLVINFKAKWSEANESNQKEV
jgi:hypothetical protein